MKKPLQCAVYKGMGGKFGAVQLNFQKPHYYRDKDKDFTGSQALDERGKLKEGWKHREGAVFLEATSANGRNSYDWDQKITLALSITDMSKIALALSTGEKCEIMHDPGAQTSSQGAVKKFLSIDFPGGLREKGGMMSIAQTSGGETRRHTVPLSTDECLLIRTLLLSAIPAALAWDQ